MIRRKSIVFSLLMLLSLGLFAQQHKSKADKASKQIVSKKFRKVRKQFSPEVKERMSYFQTVVVWKMVEAQAGKFEKLGESTFEDAGELEKYSYLAYFERGILKINLNYNEEGKIAGLFFSPLDYKTPEYASNLIYGKERLTVKTDTFEMEGELILPDKCDQCPVIILVHGSGANDRDENLRPNKVFYDLSMGLAKHGIATIRYDKRTYTYRDFYGNVEQQYNLYDETIDDAVSAVELVKQFPQLDSNRIFVLGHSLGGYAAPLIAQECDEIDGIIVFAGPSRPLNDIIVEQYEFLFAVDGKVNWGEKWLIKRQKKISKRIASNDFDTTANSGKLMAYWPGMWWRGVQGYNPVATAAGLDTRIFVMQGDQDFQVSPEGDYPPWEEGLGESGATYKLYPGLNHLFMEGKKADGPSQYLVPSNVPEYVIMDIANWVKK